MFLVVAAHYKTRLNKVHLGIIVCLPRRHLNETHVAFYLIYVKLYWRRHARNNLKRKRKASCCREKLLNKTNFLRAIEKVCAVSVQLF